MLNMSQQPCSQQQQQQQQQTTQQQIQQQTTQQQQQQQSEVDQQHLRLQQEIQSHQVAVMQQLATTDPEEFRNISIASLRQKAQEHSAKLHSFSADASLLNNTAALLRGRSTTCDANANNLHHGDHVSSSDTSSSIF